VEGVEANEERCSDLVEKSLALGTALVPAVGYDRAASIVKKAHEEQRTVREVAEGIGSGLARAAVAGVLEGDVLDLLQSFGALDGARRARYLGVQLVTVLPLGKDEISTWPHGPSDVCRIVDRFLGVLPMMYWKLDRDLVRVHDSRRTEGDEGRSLWIGDSSG
jgi:hypothetical protein